MFPLHLCLLLLCCSINFHWPYIPNHLEWKSWWEEVKKLDGSNSIGPTVFTNHSPSITSSSSRMMVIHLCPPFGSHQWYNSRFRKSSSFIERSLNHLLLVGAGPMLLAASATVARCILHPISVMIPSLSTFMSYTAVVSH